MTPDSPLPIDIDSHPAHYIRRLQQIAVAVFLQETEVHGVTPVQYAALQTIGNLPGIDQRTLAGTIGLDTSTIAGVIDRLEARQLVVRSASEQDRRVRLLHLTDAAQTLLVEMAPHVMRSQALLLAPLAAQEQEEFMRLIRRLVTQNNALSRAPSDLSR